MTANGWFQIVLFLALILAITKPLGVFMARVFSGERTFLDPVLRPIERLLYRVTGVDEKHEMRWTEYAFTMLLFSGAVDADALFNRAHAVVPALEPAALCRRLARAGFQYSGVIYDEYKLAELFGRDHHELLHANGRPRLPQLCFVCCRHCTWRSLSSAVSRGAKKKPLAISGST